MIKEIIDFHAHILPGLDHGSPNLAHSLQQLAAAQKVGVTQIVATSHFYVGIDQLDNFLQKRKQAVAALNLANTSGIKIIPAAEVRIAMGCLSLADYQKLQIGNSGYILLEMPSTTWTNNTYDTLLKISGSGLKIIIAHVDRYPAKDVEHLLSFNFFAQLNATALQSWREKGRFIKMIKNQQITVLGSDVHLDSTSDYAVFGKALKVLGPLTDNLMGNAAAILAGNGCK